MSLDVYLNKDGVEVFEANITHNLGRMADEAGIYEALWGPQEIGITKAAQLIEPLRAGLHRMVDESDRFRGFDAENGWGTYDDFLPWIVRYLAACQNYPEADVKVSR
jgi:hypothetical protein